MYTPKCICQYVHVLYACVCMCAYVHPKMHMSVLYVLFVCVCMCAYVILNTCTYKQYMQYTSNTCNT